MKTFRLTYGRVVILTREITADSKAEAWNIAHELESTGQLGLEPLGLEGTDAWEATQESTIKDIIDDGTLWELEEVP